jgi:hypothetical protein
MTYATVQNEPIYPNLEGVTKLYKPQADGSIGARHKSRRGSHDMNL